MRYIKLFEEYILEGGNAFDDIQKFSGSEKNLVADVVSGFLDTELGLSESDYRIVGSFTNLDKNSSFNDIDIIVKAKKFLDVDLSDFSEVSETLHQIQDKLKDSRAKTRMFSSIGLITTRVRIETGKFLQLDIFPVNNLDWGEFVYYSPDPNITEYKGLYRNALFEAIAKSIHFDIKKFPPDHEDTGQGDIESYMRYRFIRNLGLWEVKDVNYGKRTPRYKKDMGTYRKITDSPKVFIKKILGDYQISDVDNFDKVWNIITSDSYKYSSNLPDIVENFRIVIEDRLKEKMPEIAKAFLKIYS